MSNITLTASMRSNLASLKAIQNQMNTTQTRLSTGKKVNSAIDNASSFYQSRALTNRASDLDSLLDSMGQGIQTIQAANEGIEAVTSYIEQAKSIANSAFALDPTSSEYETQVKNYQDQYNAILKEIGTLAKDSSYQGINLLTGGKLTVMFNETRTHWLDVQGKDIVTDMAGGDIAFTTANWLGDVEAKAAEVKTARDAVIASGVIAADAAAWTALGDNVYVDDGNGGFVKSTAWKDNTTKYYTKATVDTYNTKVEAYDTAVGGVAEKIDASLDSVAKAVDYLRDYSSELGNNFSIIETRQNFTDALVDVLETGSDNLVLADMNEESANYLALQTRQQLAINSLALASQSAQSVLSLF